MQTNKSKVAQLEHQHDIQFNFSEDGCVVFFKNTMEADLILYTEEINQKYILENFDMVVDVYKFTENLNLIHY